MRFALTQEYTNVGGTNATVVGLTTDDHDLVFSSGILSGNDPSTSTPTQLAPGADAFLAFLRGRPDLKVSETTPTTVDGLEAVQVDVTTSAPAEVGVFSTDQVSWSISPGNKDRYIVVDVDGQTVLIALQVGVERDFDRVAQKAQKVIDSIEFIR